MGNYQKQLEKQPAPLRPVDNQPVRLHMFGNPFKVNKQVQALDFWKIHKLVFDNANVRNEFETKFAFH